MISAGVLISFNLTNSSLLVIRRCDPIHPNKFNYSLILFNILSIILNIVLTNIIFSSTPYLMYTQFTCVLLLFLSLIFISYFISVNCPENEDTDGINQFRVPYLPYVPLFGIFVNYLLLAQLSYQGICLMFFYFGIACFFYFGYGIHNSKGNNTGWRDLLSTNCHKSLAQNNFNNENQKYINLNTNEDIVMSIENERD